MADNGDEPAGRSKRQKVDKGGRLAALDKFRQLKGKKRKYEVEELDNVYEEVDEKDYSKAVLERQNDDWIVDDDGSGYVEDGREIFDDDLDAESVQRASKMSSSGPRKSKHVESKSKGDIRNLFVKMGSKKKKDSDLSNVEDENILGDLMSELKSEPPIVSNPQARKKFAVKNDTPLAKPATRELTEDIFNEPLFDKIIAEEKPIVKKLKVDVVPKEPEKNNASKDIPVVTTPIVEPASIIDDMNIDFNDFADSMEEEQAITSKPQAQPTKEVKEPVQSKCKGMNDTNGLDSMVVNKTWMSGFNESDLQSTGVEIKGDLQLPLVANAKKEKVFRFYWTDAVEDPFKYPGVVFLCGKVYVESVKKHVSCCVTVRNIPRRYHLLPRAQVGENAVPCTMQDVYNEFSDYATKRGISNFRSRAVKKKYAFACPSVPSDSEYLEVRYPTSHPPLAEDYSGNTIEKVFGAKVNALELFLIERKIKGPSWLEVVNPTVSRTSTSWCKLQVDCLNMENISVTEDLQLAKTTPAMTLMALNVRAAMNINTRQNEVAMVGILIHSNFRIDKASPKPPFEQHYCLVTRSKGTQWPLRTKEQIKGMTAPKILMFETETDLLAEFLNIMEKTDPDLLVGYDCGFQLDVLIHRILELRVSNWSRVGKIKRTGPPFLKGALVPNRIIYGRPVCDIQVSAKELNLKVRSYDLQSLTVAVLNKKEEDCREVDPASCNLFYTTFEKLKNLIIHTMNEASNILFILFELNVLPLAVQITCIAGNTLSKTLSGGRAERNEFLLLHAFHQKGYLLPDKQTVEKSDNSKKGARKKPAYSGGLVLEPKKGFYDKLILLMDFNSLYPSIIQEFNLCFTTVPGAAYAELGDLELPSSDKPAGIVPTEIRKLVESRVEVKKLMKGPNVQPELKMQYNIRQLALKLTANSMYGCLGATYSRFFAKGLAALITSKGREILMHTKELVERMNYNVIYGDTDSIMINTNLDDFEQVYSVGNKIKQEVNKQYKKLELDIDGVFRYLLLLQKKKYAVLTVSKGSNGQLEYAEEHKGLDIVRRDWCQLACEIGKKVLQQLLSNEETETKIANIKDILKAVGDNVRNDKIPLSQLVITKQLSKNPKEYPDKNQPHVRVALRMNDSGGRHWKAGDTVPYIICTNTLTTEPQNSVADKAYHIEEFKKSEGTLHTDKKYYVDDQLYPVVVRLCEPIEELDPAIIGSQLGVQKLIAVKSTAHTIESNLESVPSSVNTDKFQYCERLKFNCPNEECKTEIVIDALFSVTNGKHLILSKCPNEKCSTKPYTYVEDIQNKLTLAMRRHIDMYYRSELQCKNISCAEVSRRTPRCMNARICSKCGDTSMARLYTESKLFNQMAFYVYIFDLDGIKGTREDVPSRELAAAYDTLKESALKIANRNAYSVVNLDYVYAFKPNSRDKVVEQAEVNVPLDDRLEDEV